ASGSALTRNDMDVFPRAFLLVFCQFAVGGLFCLSIPSFHAVARGYYKSSAAVYVLVAALTLLGRATLWWSGDAADDGWRTVEIALWAVFVGCASAYLASLWSERMVLRARLFVASWMTGFAALIALAEGYRQAPVLSFESLFFPFSFLLSALLLAAPASGMLLGHWYLIDRDFSLQPLSQTVTVYRGGLFVQLVLFGLLLALLGLAGAPAARAGVQAVLTNQQSLLAARLVISPLGAAMLGWMVRRTLDIPQTVVAAGPFYI